MKTPIFDMKKGKLRLDFLRGSFRYKNDLDLNNEQMNSSILANV